MISPLWYNSCTLLFPWTNPKTLLFIAVMLIQVSDEGVPSGFPPPIAMLVLLLITYSLPLYSPISYVPVTCPLCQPASPHSIGYGSGQRDPRILLLTVGLQSCPPPLHFPFCTGWAGEPTTSPTVFKFQVDWSPSNQIPGHIGLGLCSAMVSMLTGQLSSLLLLSWELLGAQPAWFKF